MEHHTNKKMDYYEDEAIYEGFHFETPLYLYVWPLLVFITVLANIIIIMILLQKKMRNTTNIALAAIAITDSLTGLVTLPTYIMVYSKFKPAETYDYPLHEMEMEFNGSYNFVYNDSTNPGLSDDNVYPAPLSAFLMTPNLCEWFMISKFFLSQSFHTMSIWLTVYLGIQRYCYVKFPFLSLRLFTVKKTVIACVGIAILAPVLHIYHVFNRKHTDHGMCEWKREEECGVGCAYLWISLFAKQLLPCLVLVIVTVTFVAGLVRGNKTLQDTISPRRAEINRRISFIVLMVMIFFIIPELPYAVFLSYVAVSGHIGKPMDLETNRLSHAIYEVLMLISFHSIFWILTIFNKRFRILLISTFTGGFLRILDRLPSFTNEHNTQPVELNGS